MNALKNINKYITIEEKEPIIDKNLDSDSANTENKEIQYRVISTRKFCISKYPARDGLKTARLIIAKLLPVFENIISPAKLAELRKGNMSGEKALELLNVDNVIKALELISDEDLDIIFNRALLNCYELLPAGNTRVLNENGTYGVEGVEHDYILSMRLVAESLIWSIGGFFDVNRLASIMSDIKVSPLLNLGM